MAKADTTSPSYLELSPDRIKEIATYLPAQPTGFGKPIDDRAYWSDPAVLAQTAKTAARAEKLLTDTFPDWNDEAYLQFTKKGTRQEGEKMQGARSSWLEPLVLAECTENKGRFLPLLDKILDAYAAEPTWTLAAHDPKLENFHREKYDVDLRASTFGVEIAETLYLLGNKLDPGVRQRIEAALHQRLLDPFKNRLLTGEGCYWTGSEKSPIQNNWNAVCLSGAVGAALMVLPDKTERAVYVAAGEHYSPYYINSIEDDGYCMEGVGYWDYGFGHYALLREEIASATGGHVELFSNPKILAIALYGVRIRIGEKTVPPFGDCSPTAHPDPRLIAYCNYVMGLGLESKKFTEMPSGDLVQTLQTPTPLAAGPGKTPVVNDPLRAYFEKVGVLVSRPGPGSTCLLGIGIKAGGNGSHSHNDIGSYAIALGDEEPTGDPGGPGSYNNKTFGPERYTFKLLNSYGHPVPVVAGQLQVDATKAKPVVLSTSFTPEKDEFKINMAPAYDVPALTQLTRTMDYSRAGTGEIAISDDATFSTASTFEDALITRGDWTQVDSKTLSITQGQAKLLVTIETSGPFTIKPETITELSAKPFTRLGIALNQPATMAHIKMVFRPAPPGA